MSSPKSLFGKTVSKKARIDNEDKQEHTTSQNTERNIPSTSVRKPSFNPALLSSAFYTGPTMYGGAGACGTSPYNQYAKSKFHDRKKTDIKVTPSAPETSMSQTSRRILDLLEQYSSPISDAKRVPINNRPTFNTQKKTLNTSSIFDISKKSVYDEPSTPNSSKAHRFRELQIPSMATLMKIKKNNRTGGNVQAAIIASMSSSLPYKPETYSLRSSADSNTYKNKIKTKVSSRSNKIDEDEMALPVNLPNISLNMTGLPTFTMEPFASQGSTTKAYTAHKKESSTFNSNLATNFKFTSPLSITKTDHTNVSKKFHFSEPLDIFSPDYVPARDEADTLGSTKGDSLFKIVAESKSNHSSDTLKKPDLATPLVNFKSGDSQQTPKSSNKRPAEQWNGNDNRKNKDSEASPLLNGDLKSSDVFEKSAHTAGEPGKIKDSSYDEILNPNVEKIKSDSALPPSPISGLESFIKKQQEQWECSSCMTRNDHSKAKCVCCESSKSGAAPAPAAPAKAATNPCYSGMASFLKKQQEQWECSCCMTRNDPNRTKCVCCEAAKPGCEPAPAASIKFNFGNTQNTFKFGIDKANDPVKPATTDEKTIAESIKKPEISTPSGGFVFGNSSTLSDAKPVNGPAGVFKFGAANGKLPASGTSAPNCAVSKPSVPFGDKKQEAPPAVVPVGGFTFGIKKDENKIPETTTAQPEIKTNLFTFSSPQMPNESKTEPDKSKPAFVTQQNDSKAATSPQTTKPLGIPAVAPTTSSVSSVPAFSFGVPQTAAKMVFPNSSPFQFGAPASSAAPAPTADSAAKPPVVFSFGAKTAAITSSTDTKTLADASSSPKPAFQLQSATAGSLFPSASTQGTNGGKGPMPNLGSGIQFNATSSTDKPKDQASAPFFGFTPSTVSTSISSGTFKSPPMFSFGSSSTAKTEPAETLFSSPGSAPPSGIFGVKPTETTLNSPSNSLFKPSPSTTVSTFQAPASSIFGSAQSVNSQMPANNMFGAGTLNTATSKPPVAIFGSSTLSTDAALQPPQAGSLFSNPNMPAPSFNAGSIFGNAPQAGGAPSQPGSLFGSPVSKPATETSSGMFMNNPQPPPVSTNMFDAPTQSGSGIFGSGQAASTPVFGASIPFGEASQNQAQQNVSFKFGSTSSTQPAGVGFGQAPAAGSAAPVFSFGSGAPAPAPTNPQFNFSMGAPSSAFPSTPGALANPAQRRIKKAVRRNVLR